MSRLANSTYTERPWRIHEVAGDFTVEDMWSFHTPGAGPDDFPTMLAAMLAAGGFDRVSMPVRLLFALRFKLGALLGWEQSASNGDYELQMAILVKANGRLGRLYMAAIAPFRYLIVYPAVTRHWERAWRDHGRPERG